VSRTVRVLRRARRDLQEIYDYAVRESPRRAGRFIDALLDTIDSLDEMSERGAIPRDPTLRSHGYRFLVFRDFLIFYKVLPTQVRVYRVVRGSRAHRGLL
jgi:toxin ParE1/3/4